MLAALALVALAGCAGGYTQPATSVSDTGATLNGIVFDPFDATVSYWFKYGKTTSYGSETSHRSLVINDRDNHPVAESVTGLASATTYHYAVCASDPNPHGDQDPGGVVVCGADRTFRTTGAITSLAIGTSPKLVPDFDPAVADYVTRCNGSVTVDVAAPAGTTVAVAGQPARSGEFSQAVTLTAGKRFDFTTTTASQSNTYHVRCLPSDFPDWTYAKPGDPSARLYILTPQNTLTPSGAAAARYVAIFDDDGVPVWWYKSAASDAKLASDTTIAWGSGTAGGAGVAGYEVHRFDGTPVRAWKTVGTDTDMHDVQFLPNGNALMLSYKPRPGTLDLSAYGGASTNATVRDPEIQEVTPSGAVVWSWNGKDHLSLDETPQRWRSPYVYGLPATLPDGRLAYDYAHINSVQQVGNTVVASFRHLDAVYAINKSDGNIIWKLGGTTTPQSLTVNDDPHPNTPLGGQHFARVLADGTLTIHDNRTNLPDPPRAVRYKLDLFNKTATWLSQVTDPDVPSSPCCGSAQRLDDGSWLMSWGGTPVVTEFGATGARHFELTFRIEAGKNGFSYRVAPVTGASPTIADLRQGMDAMP